MSTRILVGNCLAVMRTLPAESVHCVVTSPPVRPGGRFVKGQHSWRKPLPHWEREWLVREYLTRRRSAAEIAAGIGCTANNVLYWLAKHGIQRRPMREVRRLKHWGVSGPRNPMFGRRGALCPTYVDGSSPERQRAYARAEGKAFLAAIRERDGYRCVRCGGAQRGLHVHHIHPWAGHPSLRFDPANVVSLCASCHRWVHSAANVTSDYLIVADASLTSDVVVIYPSDSNIPGGESGTAREAPSTVSGRGQRPVVGAPGPLPAHLTTEATGPA